VEKNAQLANKAHISLSGFFKVVYTGLITLWLLGGVECVFGAPSNRSSTPLIVRIEPDDDRSISVIAGTVIQPSVYFADQRGGVLPGDRIHFSLAEGSDNIGYFDGDRFVATTVGTGAIVAEIDGVRGVSSAITVNPGQLTEILLSISADQVVGHPLVGTAKLVLLDEFNNLLTNYDLATQPISLICDTGLLTPALVADTLLFDSGIINFLSLGTTYTGPSARAGIVATNGTITSNNVIVSFNGYDVHAANDISGETVSVIYADLPTRIQVVVSNGGDHLADVTPQLKAYFGSGGGSVKVLFTPHTQGQPDTVLVNLPTEGLFAGEDTLVLELESKYRIGDSVHATIFFAYLPVTVNGSVTVTLVSGSMRPDSVYAGIPFSVGFDVRKSGLVGPVDSSRLELALAEAVNGPAVATLYTGPITPVSNGDSILRFSGIPAVASPSAVIPGNSYVYRAGIALYSGGNLISLDSAYDGSLLVLEVTALDVDTSSVVPPFVTERDEIPFAFDIYVPGTRTILVNPSSTSFRVYTTGFSNSKGIVIPQNQLTPGVNHVTTNPLFFPSVTSGKDISLDASFSYRVAGADNEATFATNFYGKTLFVRSRPEVTILRTEAKSPNAPHVNTGQDFSVECTFTTTAEVDNLELRLKSEGQSIFQGGRIIPHVGAFDTVTIEFSIVADTIPTAAEVFTTEIISTGVTTLPAIDNVEVITIERPARLSLLRSLVGTVNNVISPGAVFGLNIRLTNSGDAPITPGIFTLMSGGIPLGISDPLIDTIDDRAPVSYELTAPDYDTTVNLQFAFVQLPADRNTGLPAAIDLSEFLSTLYVSEMDAHLQVEVVDVSSSVAVGGTVVNLATIRLAMAGTSTLSDIDVIDMEITVADFDGRPIEAREVFVVGGTGVYSGDLKLSVTTAGGDMVKFLFGGLEVSSAESQDLTLRATLQNKLPHGIKVFMRAQNIHAIFNSGPVAGQSAQVVGPGGADMIFEIPFEITGPTLATSFVVRENPFNPDKGAVEFRYLPTDPAGVKFRVFTLDGQEVYERDYPVDLTAGAGDPFVEVFWDGRNNAGDLVRNGVYLVILTGLKTQEQARLKLAVIR
jgi:hypothetical protein